MRPTASASRVEAPSATPLSCSMSAALVRRVLDHGGDAALAELMRLSGVRCDPGTLLEEPVTAGDVHPPVP